MSVSLHGDRIPLADRLSPTKKTEVRDENPLSSGDVYLEEDTETTSLLKPKRKSKNRVLFEDGV